MPETTGQKTRKGADKRRLILDSAVKVFARKGFDGTRIADIASEAGIAYGLVYHYFDSKEGILDTIFLDRWSDFIEDVEAIVALATPVEDRLRGVAETIARAYCEHSEWVKVLVFEIQRSQRRTDPERLHTVAALFRLVARLLREGQESGVLRDDVDADLACYIFVGGLDIVVTSRVLDLIPLEVPREPGEGGDDAFSHKLACTVVDLFLAGMAAPRRPGAGRAGERPDERPAESTGERAGAPSNERAEEEGGAT